MSIILATEKSANHWTAGQSEVRRKLRDEEDLGVAPQLKCQVM